METLFLSATEEGIARAAETIRNGGLCALPTETVYGLGANGFDPRTDERFIKHGTSVYDSLFDFRQKDKTFSHTPDDGKGDALATDQALMAFMALLNFENGKSGAFIFTD